MTAEFATADAADRVAFIAAAGDHKTLYVVDWNGRDAGEPRVIYESASHLTAPRLSADGVLVACASAHRSVSLYLSVLAFDASNGNALGELWDGDETTVQPITFARQPDDHRLLVDSNRSGDTRPAIWDPGSGGREEVGVGDLAGDVIPVDWSPNGAEVLACHFHRAQQKLHLLHADGRVPSAIAHGTGSVGYLYRAGSYFTPDARAVVIRSHSSSSPGQLRSTDLRTNQSKPVLAFPRIGPRARPFRSVDFSSTDGTPIQGWLAVPEGTRPFPTLLETHGGPEDVDLDVWLPDRQPWLDHGFAYLSINYRGSTTFGKAFQEQIWGQPGRWEIEDMVSAREWLVSQRIALPEAVFPIGWSYGGFLTLLALGRRPKLWAGGMAAIAIGDWRLLYQDSTAALRGYCRGLFGGTPDQLPQQYSESSPITYAEQVRSPVLIIQGRGDTRTPPSSIEAYEVRLRELGKPVEVEWFDAGHLGASDVSLTIRQTERMLEFASRIIGAG